MQYARLGSSGLKVSRLALGCMSYGEPGLGTHPWSLPEEESLPFIAQALDLGINFFDTANVYSLGTSEEFLGRAVRKLTRREDVVIATKVYERLTASPLSGGLSRSAIMRELDASLRRLDTDYIDLYIIHRWDHETPVEETMEALHDVVRAGKVRYIGASSMRTWQFVKAQYVADLHGWTRFVSMQNHYNLVNREEEREMLPYCLAEGVGVTPWSPLARGGSRGTGTPPRPVPRATRSRSASTDRPSRRTARSPGWSPRSPPNAACRWPRWPSPGYCTSRRSPHPSSARPGPTTSKTRWPPSTRCSTTPNWPGWRRPIRRTPSWNTSDRQVEESWE